MEHKETTRKQIPKRSFLHKWNRQSLPLRIAFVGVTIFYTVMLILFTLSLLKLEGIETAIRIVILSVLYLHLAILILVGVVLFFTKRTKRFIFLLVLSVLYACALSIGSKFVDKTYGIIENVQKKFVDYTSVMISLVDTSEYEKIGIISAQDDPTGYIIPQEIIKEQSIHGEFIDYDDYISMLSDLYDGEIDAMFVSDGYITMYSSYEKFANIQSDTKVIYTKTKKMQNVDNISYSSKNLTEPFTILLMGVDSTGNSISSNASFNGDSLMMITFNPKTLNATVFSIPRDTYVPIACRGGQENKINASAYGGTTCVVKTIEDLTDIKIDYYAKINFNGVVKLVDDLGGIEVDVPMKFCEQDSQRRFGEYLICLDPGYQKLNGEQALALARHRKTLPLGDFQRVQNQQLVVEGMVRELKNINNADDFYQILNDVADNVDTNMSTSQILSLYHVAKNILISALTNSNTLSIEKTYLTGYDLTMYMDSMRSYAYTFQYYKQSLEDIVHLMKVNLEIEEPRLIKTFSFDANETYEKAVTGKTYYNEKRRELMPNFAGLTRSQVEAWANEHQIHLEIEAVDSSEPKDTVLTQSEHVGKLVDYVQTLHVTVSNNDTSMSLPSKDPIIDDDDQDEEVTVLPDFTGMSLDSFNKWKSSLKNVNLITDIIELSPEDILTLDELELKNNTIYKQSAPEGTKLEDLSSLQVYYYKES